ncbi:MAG TPA: hypothetical protein DCR12_05275 [Lachnospiraceae bacterium]|nr:hypothetical protein [Lachnospiraceae bacterium]
MRQTKRKFVALSTALAMALVLVASLVPSFGARAQEIKPSGGGDNQVTLMPDGTLHDGYTSGGIARLSAGSVDSFTVDATNKVATFKNLSLSGTFDIDESGWTFVFEGTNVIKKNETEFGATGGQLNLEQGSCTIKMANDAKLTAVGGVGAPSEDAIKLADGTTVNKNPFVTTFGSQNPITDVVFSGSASGGGGTDPSEDPTVDPTEDTSTVTTVTDGSSATIAPAEDGTLSFRIDKPLSYFEDGGELYIDGILIERSQYTYKEGSTIITLVKELATKLSDGAAHVFKVKFNDGTEVTSNITVGTAAASSAANGTSGTASSTAATTTKVTSPKTADVLPIAGIALVFVGATAIGVIAIRRKNS